jgi:hypothetical protein
MRDERSCRRPEFRPGIDLRLADGQVWSLPRPAEPPGDGEAAGEPGRPEATWDDRSYRAIVRAALEAEDEGDLFRAEIALAIHLLRWNYTLDPDDLEDLLDDHGERRRRADLAHALSTLTLAHFRPFALPAGSGPGRVAPPGRDDLRRVVGHEASPNFRRRVPREAEGSIDRNP